MIIQKLLQPLTEVFDWLQSMWAFVPFDSMVAEGFPNLIVAGRSVSADPSAFASLRVQGTAMTLGEAAGRAAAFAAETGLPVYRLSGSGFSVRTDFE